MVTPEKLISTVKSVITISMTLLLMRTYYIREHTVSSSKNPISPDVQSSNWDPQIPRRRNVTNKNSSTQIYSVDRATRKTQDRVWFRSLKSNAVRIVLHSHKLAVLMQNAICVDVFCAGFNIRFICYLSWSNGLVHSIKYELNHG